MTVSHRLLVLWSRIIGPLLVATALVLMGGCSAVKLGYNNLPEIGYWWIDGYADLGEVQSVQLRRDLARLHAWHRANELLQAADLLQQVQLGAQSDTSAQDVCRFYEQVRERVDILRVQAEPVAVTLAMSLSPAQIRHLETRFAKRNAEWRRKWLAGNRTERMDKRLKASIERAEQFYGTLDDRQRDVLEAGMTSAGFDPQRSYTERLRRQQDLLQLVQTVSGAGAAPQPTAEQAANALHAYLDRLLQSPDPAYRAYWQTATQENCRTYAQLHNSTSAQQRARAIARVAAYERDARELARLP